MKNNLIYSAEDPIWALHCYFPSFTTRKNILQAFPWFHTNRLHYSGEATEKKSQDCLKPFRIFVIIKEAQNSNTPDFYLPVV